jgi:hypothetical protein
VFDDFQRRRLRFEEEQLKESHPHCEFWMGDDWAIAKIWHSAGGSWYRLRVYVPGGYPDEKPRVYVEEPAPLRAYLLGKKISDYAPSHNFHVLTTSQKGEVQICHFSDAAWDASKSLHLVVLKAKLWLQAYAEHHLRTGQPICDFFNDCQ